MSQRQQGGRRGKGKANVSRNKSQSQCHSRNASSQHKRKHTQKRSIQNGSKEKRKRNERYSLWSSPASGHAAAAITMTTRFFFNRVLRSVRVYVFSFVYVVREMFGREDGCAVICGWEDIV